MINGFCRMWQNPFAISPLELVLPGVPCYFPPGQNEIFCWQSGKLSYLPIKFID